MSGFLTLMDKSWGFLISVVMLITIYMILKKSIFDDESFLKSTSLKLDMFLSNLEIVSKNFSDSVRVTDKKLDDISKGMSNINNELIDIKHQMDISNRNRIVDDTFKEAFLNKLIINNNSNNKEDGE